MKAWPVLGIFIIQVILFLAHWFLYPTWIAFWRAPRLTTVRTLRIVLFVLAFSFVAASLLSFRFYNPWSLPLPVRGRLAGLSQFPFLGSLLAWLVWYGWLVSGSVQTRCHPALIAGSLYAWPFSRVFTAYSTPAYSRPPDPVSLPGLPASWHGRKAVLISDLHLGTINGVRFCRRVVAIATGFTRTSSFIPGDLFDGTKANLDQLVAPFKELTPPFGIYFSTGNHEEFADQEHYIEAIKRAGIRFRIMKM